MELERRAFVRYPSSRPSACEANPGAESYRCRWARMLNVSRGGIGLVLPRSLESGTPLSILVKSDAHEMLYELQARVASATLQDDDTWLVGCEFFIPLREDQLKALLG